MKISGCTIARKAKAFDYPVIESINSILPICDEYIVNIGSDKDGTKELIESINSPKIKILTPFWDENFKEKGKIFSQQTNIAMKECKSYWIFYLQADEVIHEDDLENILTTMKKNLVNPEVEGFDLEFIHFYGAYNVIQDHPKKWYPKATRIVRNMKKIVSWDDALGFRVIERNKERHLKLISIPVKVYHYGWCRNPEKMVLKQKTQDSFYDNDKTIEMRYKKITPENIYSDRGNLAYFEGKHPKVMLERVKNQNWKWDPKIDNQLPKPLRMFIIKYFYWFQKKLDSLKRAIGI